MKSTIFAVAASVAVFALAPAFANAQDTGKLTQTDRLLIESQKICPVSGKKLGSMGEPVKAKVGEQTVFLCCQGCLGQPMSKESWAKVTANLATAQGRCPVMKRPLPKNAKSIVVEGRRVFVCCPPCTTKIEANPEEYLAVVDALIMVHLAKKKEAQ